MASAEDEISTTTPQDEFSIPWDDSDLVLLVEEQQLHVHRFILKMASPVFKAMLSSDFKEKDAVKIPLPGKKADDFVVLLKQIYPQFDRKSIALDNVERIYILAEEYQIGAVKNACRDILKSVDKTKENAMEILLKAQICQADEARQQCYEVLQQWTLTDLEYDESFEKLDGQSARGVLLQKAKSLEVCLRNVQPQIWGLLNSLLYFLSNPEQIKKEPPHQCSSYGRHLYRSDKSYSGTGTRDLIRCLSCKARVIQLGSYLSQSRQNRYFNCRDIYVKENIVQVLEEMENLL